MPDHARSSDSAVQTQLDRFAALSPGRDILGLERIAALLDVLGNPQASLPPVFHVAGTNGKGSTCAFLRAAIEAAGLTAHVYTSPHLVRFNERIRVAGKLIEDGALAAILAEVLDAAERHQIGASFFEITTAVAFIAFARTAADAAIIEVGLGGRLDATNIIARPAICGIASLGIDHEAFLLTPEDGVPADPSCRIGWEKAGIAKRGVPIIAGHYRNDVNAVIAGHAHFVGALLLTKKVSWDSAIYDGQIAYRDAGGVLKLPLARLPGEHQANNAALAVAMLRHQNELYVPESAISAAMEWAQWPARLQMLGDGPVKALLPKGTAIWLDGGHNDDAGMALARHFSKIPSRIHLVIGMLTNKSPQAIVAPLADKLASVTVLPVPGHDHHPAEAFAETSNVPVRAAPDIASALSALRIDPATEIILICGSLYLAGSVLTENNEIPS